MVHIEGKDDRMVANNLEPHYLPHPGEVIKEELEFRGISQRRLASEIGVPASQLNEVCQKTFKCGNGFAYRASIGHRCSTFIVAANEV